MHFGRRQVDRVSSRHGLSVTRSGIRSGLEQSMLVIRRGTREKKGRIGTRKVIPGSAPSGGFDPLAMP